ncbi:MAG: 50S ribosomal protein L18 [Phycisphaerales bacterium]|nr:50S ribosomal protein L18 [Phycisphaerales bacterium]
MGETINQLKQTRRTQRKLRTSGSVRGTTERPRLSIFRSVKNIYAQVIDDTTGKTLVAASSLEKDVRGTMKHGGNKGAAAEIGKTIAAKAIAKGVTQVAFDRNGYRYHGRVKALADAARKAGLKF